MGNAKKVSTGCVHTEGSMTLTMSDTRILTLDQLDTFTHAAEGVTFVGAKKKEKYEWIDRLLARFFYESERKKNKTIIRNYIMKMTGYADAQVTRLIRKKKKTKRIRVAASKIRASFPTKYTAEDIARIIKTDNAHLRLSGKATKEIFRREYDIFHHEDYVRLKDISVAHIYNLRGTRQYVSHALTFTKTNPTTVPIGERRKPRPNGKPGYIRVDSVHQGDQDKEKGVYHINLVDSVTQWELIGCVEGISEHFLVPLLEALIEQFPFRIIEIHSDNGSEYINRIVAALLEKLRIKQTKSRPRRSNDNALAESKNGGVVRKCMGYIHIPKKFARAINNFYQTHFNVYVNYHRPSGFATERVDRRGKITKVYDTYKTPYEAFKGLENPEQYLKEGVSFTDLDTLAYAMSDNECAILVQTEKDRLFTSFRK